MAVASGRYRLVLLGLRRGGRPWYMVRMLPRDQEIDSQSTRWGPSGVDKLPSLPLAAHTRYLPWVVSGLCCTYTEAVRFNLYV